MGLIGAWGSLAFSVNEDAIKTFNKLKWDIGAKYSTHTRHLKEPLLEFAGPDTESISFSMLFSVDLGVSPKPEIDKLVRATKAGEVHRLVIGTDNYGMWVIEKVSNTMGTFDNRGNLWSAEVSVSMKSYSPR
ncbi:MAG: phage tail protein [Eubacteriales bacterium]